MPRKGLSSEIKCPLLHFRRYLTIIYTVIYSIVSCDNIIWNYFIYQNRRAKFISEGNCTADIIDSSRFNKNNLVCLSRMDNFSIIGNVFQEFFFIKSALGTILCKTIHDVINGSYCYIIVVIYRNIIKRPIRLQIMTTKYKHHKCDK